jgi:plasmid stability protein
MAELTIREIDPEIIDRLTQLAKQHQRSIEEEHRAILREALYREHPAEANAPFEAFLGLMPDVGHDDDFSRIQGAIRSVELGE